MKKILFILFVTLFLSKGYAQVAISVEGYLPDGSAMLDVISTTKGVLFPRITLAQRNAIVFPATGLMIFQTDGTPGLYVNTGSPWVPSWSLAGGGGSGWSLSGNSGTTASNFIGTTDNVPFNIRVNNQISGTIDPTIESTCFGYLAGNNGTATTAFGDHALFHNIGGDNTAIGFNTLYKNTSGSGNTATGFQAQWNNLTGSNNTGTGSGALFMNSAGSNNTATGSQAMLGTSGSDNVATGYQALQWNQGNINTATGSQALSTGNLTGSYNTATGFQALAANTTGEKNTATGYQALAANTTAFGNTATGYQALLSNKTGNDNTAVGERTLEHHKTGYANTAVGFVALNSDTSGVMNTAIGDFSLALNTNGSENTGVGESALWYNTTGSYNTALGVISNMYNETGSYNTTIGYNAGALSQNRGLSNTTCIGSNTWVTSSNYIRIGSTSVQRIEGQVPWSYPSDGRFKNTVKENVKGLEFIAKLRPVTYKFDTRMFDEFLMKSMPDSVRQKRVKNTDYSESQSIVHTGFIAQEVEKAALECGYTFDGVIAPKNDADNYGVAYSQFTVPLVKAVQELNEKNIQLQKRLEDLEARLAKLETHESK